MALPIICPSGLGMSTYLPSFQVEWDEPPTHLTPELFRRLLLLILRDYGPVLQHALIAPELIISETRSRCFTIAAQVVLRADLSVPPETHLLNADRLRAWMTSSSGSAVFGGPVVDFGYVYEALLGVLRPWSLQETERYACNFWDTILPHGIDNRAQRALRKFSRAPH